MGRDRAQPLGLAGRPPQVIDVLNGKGTSQRAPDSGKLGDRQCGHGSLLCWLVW
jgi:hypothetical protein